MSDPKLSTELVFTPTSETSGTKRKLLLHFQVKNGKDVTILSAPSNSTTSGFTVLSSSTTASDASSSGADLSTLDWSSTSEVAAALAKERKLRIDLENKLATKIMAMEDMAKSYQFAQAQLKQHSDAQTHRDAYLSALRSQVYTQRGQIQKLKEENAAALKKMQLEYEAEIQRLKADSLRSSPPVDPQVNELKSQLEEAQRVGKELQEEVQTLRAQNDASKAKKSPSSPGGANGSGGEPTPTDQEVSTERERTRLVSLELSRHKFKSQNEIKFFSGLLVKAQDDLAKVKGVSDVRQKLIALAITKFKQLKPWLGVQIVSGPSNGVRVVMVHRGSPADEAGFRKGDIIETGMGLPTRTNSEFKTVIAQVRTGDLLDFRIQRASGLLDLIKAQIVSRALTNYDSVLRLKRVSNGIVVKGDDEFVRGLVSSPNKAEDTRDIKENRDKDKDTLGKEGSSSSSNLSISKENIIPRVGSMGEKDLSPLYKKDGGKNR